MDQARKRFQKSAPPADILETASYCKEAVFSAWRTIDESYRYHWRDRGA
jgi:hypothetical protein